MRKILSPAAAALGLALAGTMTGCGGGGAPAAQAEVAAADADVVVYKSPTCGCCGAWVDHMRDAGYEVETVDVDYGTLSRKKEEHGVPSDLGSCHTAVVEGYTVEGHVPADVIARLIAERPSDIRGIAVPGMPVGSPGMEGPNPQPYDVVAIREDGSRAVYETVYPGQPASETR